MRKITNCNVKVTLKTLWIPLNIFLCVFSFNPVAPTTMMKVLSRISAAEAGKVSGIVPTSLHIFGNYLFFVRRDFCSAYFLHNSEQSCGRMCVTDPAVLETLCSGSSGDIRSAINSLQFSSLPGLTSAPFLNMSYLCTHVVARSRPLTSKGV